VRNQLEIHLTNKRGEAVRFRLAVEGDVPADVRLGQTDLELPPLGDARIPLVISVESRDARPGLSFRLDVDSGQGARRRQDIRFVAPLGRAPSP
jgi:hypothetical protein